MANDWSPLVPKIIAEGLLALRKFNKLPSLVNTSFANNAREIGDTITFPLPSAITVADVTPAATPPSTSDTTQTSVTLVLNKWKEGAWYMTDKEMWEALKGPARIMQASEAVKAVVDQMCSDLFAEYKGVYGFAGTAGTTPFASDVTAATTVRKLLNQQLCPMSDRRFVVDFAAEANALNQRAFQDASYGGGNAAILEGQIGRKLGFDWYSDHQVPTHTQGTLSDGDSDNALVNGALSAGATTMNIDATTLTGTLVAGDIITFSTHAQTYVITTGGTASGNAMTGIVFSPGLTEAVADNTEITLKGTHVVNLAFHRDAFAMASRPLWTMEKRSVFSQIFTDSVSGLSLRLQISEEYNRTRFAFDALYGVKLIRKELACRLAG